jgi:hypothetical protein
MEERVELALFDDQSELSQSTKDLFVNYRDQFTEVEQV